VSDQRSPSTGLLQGAASFLCPVLFEPLSPFTPFSLEPLQHTSPEGCEAALRHLWVSIMWRLRGAWKPWALLLPWLETLARVTHGWVAVHALLLQVVRCLVALGIIVPSTDMLSVKRAIGYFLETINRQAEQQEAVAVSC
jgi:hypothetical protein